MSEITYEFVEGRGNFKVNVRLDGKFVGVIRVVEGGFAYFPKGSRKHGDVFKTMREVQQSLEPESEDQLL